jgi:CheY-like chemotaxis protein
MATEEAPRPRGSVLYLEDSPADAALASGALKSAGFEVEVVSTAGQCLDHLSRYRYAVLLVDQILDPFEGTDLLRSFRCLRLELPTTWVVSASEDPALPERARREGARFLAKGRWGYVDALIEAVASVDGANRRSEAATR